MTTTANIIHVSCEGGSYDVHEGRGQLANLGKLTHTVLGPSSACIITDSHVGPLYGSQAKASLEAAGIPTVVITFPAGERSKNHVTLFEILEQMAASGITRDGCVVCLGGGVTGDMGGLAAGLYLRGIPVVQVPTTLLSMVDSSVGGKCAIDLEAGKNLAGVFLQPSLVVADPEVLVTLPQSQLCDSCGEIVKHAMLADSRMLEDITREPLIAPALDLDRLADVIARNIDIKREVVEADEREGGLRQTLNFGHTIGHAIEAASNFKLGHGTCVALGMIAISRAAAQLGWCETATLERLEAAVEAQGLPTSTQLDAKTLMAFIGRDKKRRADGVTLAIVERVGHPVLRKVGIGELERLLEAAVKSFEA